MAAEKVAKKEDYNVIVRIFNTDLSGKKRVINGLTKIKGVGLIFCNAVLHAANIDPQKFVGQLTPQEIEKIENILKEPAAFKIPSFMLNRPIDVEMAVTKHLLGSDLKLQTEMDIRRMRRIRSRKGFRHEWGLKVRGQRTKSTGRKGGPAVAKKKVVKK